MVIAIIAILAALLLPALGRARDKAKLAACLSQHRQLFAALTLFADDHDGVPPLTNKDSCDPVTGLVGTPGDSYDPYRWVYFGMAHVWASGYFSSLELLICPGFENHVDEIAAAWQSVNIVQPGGKRLLSRLVPIGPSVNGIPSWKNPTGYLAGTYSTCVLAPDSGTIPLARAGRLPRRTRTYYPIFLCAQSIWNPQQASGAWYQQSSYDCHRREAMNCTYGDGSAKSLSGVWKYAVYLNGVSDWTWQLASTANSWGYYWWPWAEAQ